MSRIATAQRHRLGRPGGPSSGSRSFRPDIQGLRALAVLLVVVYHLWPAELPGGFVGVDVFFVISGYLITGNLAINLSRTGRVKLLEFWGRRARRLLPAAALVLLVTWLVARVVLPASELVSTADQVRASAFYYQNWTLAGTSTNYLTAQDPPTPVQHFWSLSVEEQFYLVWPLLFVIAALVAWRWNRQVGRSVMAVLAALVVGASLWYSAHETAANPAAAYFLTTTRMWELAAGGLLVLARGRVTRFLGTQGWLSWVGLALIIYSAVTLSGASAFPGTVALLPVGGALLMLACGSPAARAGTSPLTSLRPAVFIGDVSYSLYLWHWPMIVFWKDHSGHKIYLVDGIVILLVAVVLSWLTKRFVEDPIRLSPRIAGHPVRSLATALAVLVPVLVVAPYTAPPPYHVHLDASHPGAAVLAGARPVAPAPTEPPVVDAQFDLIDDTACQTPIPGVQPRVCITGDTVHPRLRVALVGDSVAGQWRKDIELIAAAEHWELITELHASCPWSATLTYFRSSGRTYPACQTWGGLALRDMLTKYKPNVVITSSRAVLGTAAHHADDAVAFGQIADGMVTYWRQLKAAGIGVVAIRETPEPGRNIPACLSTPGNTPRDCTEPADKAISDDTPLVQAVHKMHGGADLVDMDDLICNALCRPIVGNVELYRDQHHLTLTYTETMLPYFRRRLLDTPTMRALVA